MSLLQNIYWVVQVWGLQFFQCFALHQLALSSSLHCIILQTFTWLHSSVLFTLQTHSLQVCPFDIWEMSVQSYDVYEECVCELMADPYIIKFEMISHVILSLSTSVLCIFYSLVYFSLLI